MNPVHANTRVRECARATPQPNPDKRDSLKREGFNLKRDSITRRRI